MSLGLYAAFNPRVSSAAPPLGEILASNIETLDRIADERGLVRLSSFADTRDVPDGFDGSREDLEELVGPWTDWFASADGARAVEALIPLLREDAEAHRFDDPAAVTDELESLLRSLRVAEAAGAKFRLELS